MWEWSDSHKYDFTPVRHKHRGGYEVRKMFRVDHESNLYKRIVNCYGDWGTFLNQMDKSCHEALEENTIFIGFWYNTKDDKFFITKQPTRPSYGVLVDNVSFLVIGMKCYDCGAYVPRKYWKDNQLFSEYGINWGQYAMYFDQRFKSFRETNTVQDDWSQFSDDYWQKYESNWPKAPDQMPSTK